MDFTYHLNDIEEIVYCNHLDVINVVYYYLYNYIDKVFLFYIHLINDILLNISIYVILFDNDKDIHLNENLNHVKKRMYSTFQASNYDLITFRYRLQGHYIYSYYYQAVVYLYDDKLTHNQRENFYDADSINNVNLNLSQVLNEDHVLITIDVNIYIRLNYYNFFYDHDYCSVQRIKRSLSNKVIPI